MEGTRRRIHARAREFARHNGALDAQSLRPEGPDAGGGETNDREAGQHAAKPNASGFLILSLLRTWLYPTLDTVGLGWIVMPFISRMRPADA
jgi:hypothetical protein